MYEYEFEYTFPEFAEGAAGGAFVGAAGIATGIMMIVYLLAIGFSLVSYVLNAVGMYRLAKRRGIHHAWLAWIPVGCNWLLGSISDHYQYIAKQRITGRRKVLLTLSIILLLATGLLAGAVAAMMLSVEASATGAMGGTILMVALIVIAYLAMMGLSIAITVICYIAYYDLFQSCKPTSAVMFLVLGVIFNVTLPFFVFACSGHDQGMPARRPRQTYAPAQDAQIPVVEAEVVDDFE